MEISELQDAQIEDTGFASVSIRPSHATETTHRQTYSLLDLMGDTGGFAFAVLTIFDLALRSY